jgi:hypothetical protein
VRRSEGIWMGKREEREGEKANDKGYTIPTIPVLDFLVFQLFSKFYSALLYFIMLYDMLQCAQIFIKKEGSY